MSTAKQPMGWGVSTVGASKIVDEGEVVRWFGEGRTYQWMCDEYRRKYNVETVPSLWGNFRRRRGLARRITRDDDLIPWAVKEEHRWAYPLAMLRVEGRRRAGREMREVDLARLEPWKQDLIDGHLVVHYDPNTTEGFFYVPARPIDTDLIRVPGRKTSPRLAAD